MNLRKTLPLVSLSLVGAYGSYLGVGSSAATESVAHDDENGRGEGGADIRHVLLVSVDGMHEVDLARFIASHRSSTFAELAERGVEYTDAHTATPSDSFPGMTSLVTGATPKTAGVYYDDSYDRTPYAPGSQCAGGPGTEVVFD